MIQNSSGKILYGMHMYPGLAQYDQPESSSKIFLNEDTLRKMDSTFAGKPIFVEHVDEVDSNLDELRKEADGWVIESFFNAADGKHWCKMVIVSDRAERAIKNGYRLSNAYLPRLNGKSGTWNGITYQNEVIDGEYEHLAIVKNPRYEESIIMTPEEFKNYNENLQVELNRIANSTTKEKNSMSLKFWKRNVIENSIDFEKTYVTLPKCGKEFSIFQIVNAMDEMEEKKKENMADYGMKVKLHDGKKCNVGELLDKYKNMAEEMEGMKKNKEEESDLEPKEASVDVEGDLHNEDDEEAKKKALELAEHEEEEIEEDKKMKNEILAKKKQNFETLKNAPLTVQNAQPNIYLNKVERGKQRYGSN